MVLGAHSQPYRYTISTEPPQHEAHLSFFELLRIEHSVFWMRVPESIFADTKALLTAVEADSCYPLYDTSIPIGERE